MDADAASAPPAALPSPIVVPASSPLAGRFFGESPPAFVSVPRDVALRSLLSVRGLQTSKRPSYLSKSFLKSPEAVGLGAICRPEPPPQRSTAPASESVQLALEAPPSSGPRPAYRNFSAVNGGAQDKDSNDAPLPFDVPKSSPLLQYFRGEAGSNLRVVVQTLQGITLNPALLSFSHSARSSTAAACIPSRCRRFVGNKGRGQAVAPITSPTHSSRHEPSDAASLDDARQRVGVIVSSFESGFRKEVSERKAFGLVQTCWALVVAAIIRLFFVSATFDSGMFGTTLAGGIVSFLLIGIVSRRMCLRRDSGAVYLLLFSVAIGLLVHGVGLVKATHGSSCLTGVVVFVALLAWQSPERMRITLQICVFVAFAGLAVCRESALVRVSTAAGVTIITEYFVVLAMVLHPAIALERTQRFHYVTEWTLGAQQRLLQQENEFFNNLLHSVLPDEVIERLIAKEYDIFQDYSMVTVMFVEVCNVLEITASRPPEAMVNVLNAVFSAFDVLCNLHDVYKVETVGPVYMIVGGCPQPAINHAEQMAHLALDMRFALPALRKALTAELGARAEELDLRIGLHSGPIVAGVVGIKAPRYKLFGDTVNTASRMSTNCSVGDIQISASTHHLISRCFDCACRGDIDVKGKGLMRTYLLQAESHHHERGAAGISDACFREPSPQRAVAGGDAVRGGVISAVAGDAATASEADAAPPRPPAVTVSTAPPHSAAPRSTRDVLTPLPHGASALRTPARLAVASPLRGRRALALDTDAAMVTSPTARLFHEIFEGHERMSTVSEELHAAVGSSPSVSTALDNAVGASQMVLEHAARTMSSRAISTAATPLSTVLSPSVSQLGDEAIDRVMQEVQEKSPPVAPSHSPLMEMLTHAHALGSHAALEHVHASSPHASPRHHQQQERGMPPRTLTLQSQSSHSRSAVNFLRSSLTPLTRGRPSSSRSFRGALSPVPQHSSSDAASGLPAIRVPASANAVSLDSNPALQLEDTGKRPPPPIARKPGQGSHGIGFRRRCSSVATVVLPPVRSLVPEEVASKPTFLTSPSHFFRTTVLSVWASELEIMVRSALCCGRGIPRGDGSGTVDTATIKSASVVPFSEERISLSSATQSSSARDCRASDGEGVRGCDTVDASASAAASAAASGSAVNNSDVTSGAAAAPPSESRQPVTTTARGSSSRNARAVLGGSSAPRSAAACDTTSCACVAPVKQRRGRRRLWGRQSSDNDVPCIAALSASQREKGSWEDKQLASLVGSDVAFTVAVEGVQRARRLETAYVAEHRESLNRRLSWLCLGTAAVLLIIFVSELFARLPPPVPPLLMSALIAVLLVAFAVTRFFASRDTAASRTAASAVIVVAGIVFAVVVCMACLRGGSFPLFLILAFCVFHLQAWVLSLAVRYFVVVVTVVASFLLYFLEPKDTHDPLRKAVTDSLVLLLIIVSGAIMTCQDEFYRRVHFYRQGLLLEQQSVLEVEKVRSHSLLKNILPETIIDQLQHGQNLVAAQFEEVTILFSDLVKFTELSAGLSARSLLWFLNDKFSRFDELTNEFDVYKVEIIGDAYFVVGGCPTKCEDHAERVVKMGLRMLEVMESVRVKFSMPTLKIRIGVHTGPVIAGVVGITDPRYHLFGPSVEYAKCMESTSEPGRVHISKATKEKLEASSSQFAFEERSLEVVRGQGVQTTYFVRFATSSGAATAAVPTTTV